MAPLGGPINVQQSRLQTVALVVVNMVDDENVLAETTSGERVTLTPRLHNGRAPGVLASAGNKGMKARVSGNVWRNASVVVGDLSKMPSKESGLSRMILTGCGHDRSEGADGVKTKSGMSGEDFPDDEGLTQRDWCHPLTDTTVELAQKGISFPLSVFSNLTLGSDRNSRHLSPLLVSIRSCAFLLKRDPPLDGVHSFWRTHARGDGHDLRISTLPAWSDEPNKIVVGVKRTHTFGNIVCVWNTILLEFREAGEDIIDAGVLR
ncbi:hypothetical protein BDM02DRAFT_3133296 [Thelephora ganbajun]|uniref:Uncharacterized protein n=1 Tax=Thelephora ganbajun TaxID=370292 RepID=A0ACB6YXG0_THEGA|nr:hypothetical protein BDM02DRAFT_3133296 [Thelephora ganbajun]